MNRHIFITLSLLITIMGCSTYRISSTDLTTNYYPPKSSTNDVKYFETAPRNYEKIGYVSVLTQRRQPLSEVLQKLKYEAAILGGDAITKIQSKSTGFWRNLPAQGLIGNAYIHEKIRAEVIILK